MIERKVTAAGAFRDAHHPEMIVWQATSVPSRSMFLEGRGPDWRPDYIRIARSLKSLGCDIGCMCCNTAHYAVGEIAEKSGLRFINLLEEVANAVKGKNLGKVVMFCSDGARKFDIYGSVFKSICPDVELIYPSEVDQSSVTKVICGVKTERRFSSEPVRLLQELVSRAEAPVVLGCTDLRVAFLQESDLPGNVAVDSLECLADSIIKVTRVEESK
jgi:aspartate racemase